MNTKAEKLAMNYAKTHQNYNTEPNQTSMQQKLKSEL